MTQNNEQDGKLTLSRPGRLELKKTVETGQVRQSFSHGRTKSVTVEVRKKRTFERGAGGSMHVVQEMRAAAARSRHAARGEPDPDRTRARRPRPRPPRRRRRRRRAQPHRRVGGRAATACRGGGQAQTSGGGRAPPDRGRGASPRRRGKPAQGRRARKKPRLASPRPRPRRRASRSRRPKKPKEAEETEDEESAAAPGRKVRGEVKRPTPGRGRDMPRRRDSGRLTISQALAEAEGDGTSERARSLASMRRARERERQRLLAEQRRNDPQRVVREVIIPDTITVSDLANRMATRVGRGDEVAHEERRHGDGQSCDRRRYGGAARDGIRPQGQARLGSRCRARHRRRAGRGHGPHAAAAGRDDHGPCRPRQDVPARRAAVDRRRGRRGGRHHPAYRRLSGRIVGRAPDHLPRHAGPRGVHRHAVARRQGHRYRRACRCRR